MSDLRYRAVLFDQDGTLINTFIPALHAYSAACGRQITLAELEPVAHLGAARHLVGALLGRAASDEEDDIFHKALAEAVASVDPYPGITDLLTGLREAGVGSALATNSDGRSAGVVLGAHGLDLLFDTIVTVDMVGAPKPDPASLLLALDRLGAQPGEAIFVGDSAADMAAARAAGVLAVAAGWGHQTPSIPADRIDESPPPRPMWHGSSAAVDPAQRGSAGTPGVPPASRRSPARRAGEATSAHRRTRSVRSAAA